MQQQHESARGHDHQRDPETGLPTLGERDPDGDGKYLGQHSRGPCPTARPVEGDTGDHCADAQQAGQGSQARGSRDQARMLSLAERG